MSCRLSNRKASGPRKNFSNFAIKTDMKSLSKEKSDGKFAGVNVAEKFSLIDQLIKIKRKCMSQKDRRLSIYYSI